MKKQNPIISFGCCVTGMFSFLRRSQVVRGGFYLLIYIFEFKSYLIDLAMPAILFVQAASQILEDCACLKSLPEEESCSLPAMICQEKEQKL